jgi:thymidylate kinase
MSVTIYEARIALHGLKNHVEKHTGEFFKEHIETLQELIAQYESIVDASRQKAALFKPKKEIED